MSLGSVFWVVGVCFLAKVAMGDSSTHRPHILLMVLDDIGRADTGVYGNSNIPMPNLVELSQRGAVLENFYTQTVCSPTRSALMTGRYPFRYGMQHYTTQLPGMSAGVPLDIPMLPLLLRNQGYDTHMIGKWHCGYATWAHTPYFRGFNSYMGYLQAQGDYFKHNVAIVPHSSNPLVDRTIDGLDFWRNQQPFYDAVGNHSLDLYDQALVRVVSQYAQRSLEDQAQHPLFLYLAHQTVHIPLQPKKPEERCNHLADSPTRRTYCSMMVELDDSVGNMIALFRNKGLFDNMLILTMTDNGGMVNFKSDKGSPVFPASQGSNFPLRGSKTTLFDGGTRSLAFISGGRFPVGRAGTRFTGLAHVVDFSATVLAAAGILPLKKEALKLDGFDLFNSIVHSSSFPRDHVPINVVLQGKRYSAVRFGKFKVIVRDHMVPLAQGWFDEKGDFLESPPSNQADVLLFNLESDPAERNDLSQQMPGLVQYGLDLIRSYVVGGMYMEPQESNRFHLEALPVFHRGVWKPFMSEQDWTKEYERHAHHHHDNDVAIK